MKLLYLKVNDKNASSFAQKSKDQPVFAKYYSPTCPACIAMENDWEDMCKDIDEKYNTDLLVASIDSLGMKEIGKHDVYNDVEYVPTIVILKDGKKIKEYKGERKKDKLLEFLMEEGLINKKMVGGVKKSKKKMKKKTSNKKKIYTNRRKTKKEDLSKKRRSVKKKMLKYRKKSKYLKK
jgi:thioredoxin-like negative regulator of GroEL